MSTFDWSRYAVGGATRPDSFSGMKPEFNGALQQLFMNAPAQYKLQVGSGYRSIERQRQLWEASDKSGKMVARPGRSRHNHGDAADLSAGGVRLDKASPEVRQWVHDNAPRYGLNFPMSYEPWHVELNGARGGKRTAAPGASATTAPTAGGMALSPTPIAEQVAPTGPAPAVFGDIVAPTQVQTTAVPGLGSLAQTFFANQQMAQQNRQQEQEADAQRKAALFGDSLFGLYG